MKNTNISICDVVIQPGESANLALPLPDFYSCTSFYIPIKLKHGKLKGPCLLIFAGVRGNELNGIQIINDLLQRPELSTLRGTLITLPVLNIFGLMNGTGFMPYEKNLEDCFPGDIHGSYGERIAELFTNQILKKATHCLELKTGALNQDLLPQIYCDLDVLEAKNLARKFAAPVINHVSTSDNSISQTAEALDIPYLTFKAGEALRFEESAIRTGVEGILNMLHSLDMIDRKTEANQKVFKPIFSQEQEWIRSHRSGVLVTEVILGQLVKKDQIIGRITDPFSANTVEPVKSYQDGVIVGINRNPLVYEGQCIFKIATFVDNNRAELTLEAWNELQVAE